MIATLPSSLLAALPIAIAAGFVSFISPCVLPLLPGYLAFLSGAAGSLEGRSGRGRAVIGALAFIVGFAIVFVSIGALAGGFGNVLRDDQRTLSIAFGSVTILLGMFFAGWWPSTWLNRERRIHYLPRASIFGAGALGFLYALGWTPCLGPTLAAIYGLEGTSGSDATVLHGAILAFFYCLGLGIPFIIAALATEWVSTASSWLRRHQRTIGRIGGLLLIVIGVLEVTGAWHSFVVWLQVHFPASGAII
jgi:cytochrome c-type biogenesis protein